MPAVGGELRSEDNGIQLGLPRTSGAHCVGFERWGIRFRENGARMDSDCSTRGSTASPDAAPRGEQH
jgi:hypothetical protein